MSNYDRFAGVNENFEFPPEVRAALLESLNIRNVGAPMTTADRNGLNTAALDPGYYIYNTDAQTFQIWRADFEEWHDGLESPGTQKWWAGSTIPPGWMKQTGVSLSRVEYSALYRAISTTYGGSDTPNYFRIPNTSGLTMVDSNLDYPLGSTGGAAKVKLLVANLAKHVHSGTVDNRYTEHSHTANTTGGSHSHGYWAVTTGEFNATGSGPAQNAVYRASRQVTQTTGEAHSHSFTTDLTGMTHNHTFTSNETGSDEPHENMQPYLAGHFIIKY